MLKISIIIPAYNAEKYISDCLKSVYSQDLPLSEYEVIVVDDGSTDRTAEITKESLKENGLYIYQENQRQGAARNNGLKAARGKFVWFVDSDDEIAPNVLDYLFKTADANNLDVLFFNVKRKLIGENTLTSKSPRECGKIFAGKEYLSLRSLSLGPCYIFKRNFLIEKNLFFLEKTAFEDAEFIAKICFYADRIMHCGIDAYIAVRRTGSTTMTFTLERAAEALNISEKIFSFAEEKKNPDLYFYSSMMFNIFFRRYRNFSGGQKSRFLNGKTVSKKRTLAALMRAKSFKYKIEALILFFFWRLYF